MKQTHQKYYTVSRWLVVTCGCGVYVLKTYCACGAHIFPAFLIPNFDFSVQNSKHSPFGIGV